jgi:ABC-type nitrate/sulfonate/bicarbonate transport system permease component
MRRAGLTLLELCVPVALVALWWALSSGSHSTYYPPLKDVLSTFRGLYLWDHMGSDVWPSVWHLLAGVALAALVGIGVGLLVGLSPRVRRDLQPTLELLRAIPVVALLPAMLVIAGPGAKMEIFSIALGSCWPILLNTVDGVRGVEPTLLENAEVYGLSRARRVRTVVVPSAMPQVFAGLRVALAVAIAVMVIANMIGSTSGIGYLVITAQQSFDVKASWAGIVMIGLIGLVANALLVALQHRALTWHRGWRAAGGTQE